MNYQLDQPYLLSHCCLLSRITSTINANDSTHQHSPFFVFCALRTAESNPALFVPRTAIAKPNNSAVEDGSVMVNSWLMVQTINNDQSMANDLQWEIPTRNKGEDNNCSWGCIHSHLSSRSHQLYTSDNPISQPIISLQGLAEFSSPCRPSSVTKQWNMIFLEKQSRC